MDQFESIAAPAVRPAGWCRHHRPRTGLPTAHSSAIIGTSVRLTVLGGRIVPRSEELA
jgi:hypothetical protein